MTAGAIAERHVATALGRLPLLTAGEGRPVLLLHGNFASGRWWLEQLRHPPDEARLLAPTLPNFAGASRLDPPVALEAYAEAALALLDAERLPRAAVVGHSLGATVAQLLAIRAPERVTAMLLVDGAGPTGLPRPEEHYAALDAMQGDRAALDAALRPLCPARRPDFWEALLDDALAMAPHAYAGNARALGEHGLPPKPGAFAAPVVVLRGARDPLIDDAMTEATARHWNGRTIRWEDIGHTPQIEAPAHFTELLANVLAGADPLARPPPDEERGAP